MLIKKRSFITYEKRFLFSLIKLIEDYMYLREKDQETEYKGKNDKRLIIMQKLITKRKK